MKKLSIAIVAFLFISFVVTHRTDSNASDCVRSTSPDGRYIAEECLLVWNHGDNPEYVGRLFETPSGKLVARRALYTTDPEIIWVDNVLLFQRGGKDDDMIILPPTLYDRIVATYWQLTKW